AGQPQRRADRPEGAPAVRLAAPPQRARTPVLPRRDARRATAGDRRIPEPRRGRVVRPRVQRLRPGRTRGQRGQAGRGPEAAETVAEGRFLRPGGPARGRAALRRGGLRPAADAPVPLRPPGRAGRALPEAPPLRAARGVALTGPRTVPTPEGHVRGAGRDQG